jgi:hypothetical protein
VRREIPISTTYEEAIEALSQFFTLDFQDSVASKCLPLRYYDNSIKVIEDKSYSQGMLVAHIVLTRFSVGLWLLVWVPLEFYGRYVVAQNVQVWITAGEDSLVANIKGSDGWVQITEVFVRRNLVNQREVRDG